jgi:glycosyltransferase involved in cell wall biosynthesis
VYGYDNNRCEVVYLGLDHDRFSVNEAEIRKPWITCVAKLTRFKNVDRIIDAVKRLIDNGNNDVQLHIVGTGDAQLGLQQQASRLGLESCVVFHGRLTDDQMIRLLRQSRGLCLASVDEPFGLVAVEAMACGVPIVAVNSGGPLEIVGQTPAGILIDRPDPELIAQAILQLLDPQHFSARSVAAQSRAADFDWERTVDRLEQIFVHEIVR